MTIYVKKPIQIEAWPVSELLECLKDWTKMPAPVKAAYEEGNILFLTGQMRVYTHQGWVTADGEDMLILGMTDELYPCRLDIFLATYNEVVVEVAE